MTRADDLVPLLTQQPGDNVRFRQGTVVAWDPVTASNVVDVAGTLLSDVPILNTAEAGLLTPGDVVGLLSTGEGARSYWIVGRITVPNTPQAGSALSAWAGRGKLASTPDMVTFNDTEFAPAADGKGPVITDLAIGNPGQALVFISATLGTPGGSTSQSEIKGVWMGFALTGPTNVPASFENSLECNVGWTMPSGQSIVIGCEDSATRMILLRGLTPGMYTVEARYRINGGETELAYATNRTLFAVPL